MSDNSTTSYSPWDSYAPKLFGETILNNYVNGEQDLSHLMISTLLLFARQPHSLYRVISVQSLPLVLIHGHSLGAAAVRSRYHTGQRGIMAVPRLGLLILTFERIRSIGSGRLSRTFYPSGYGLIQFPKAPMANAKDSFHHKSLCSHFVVNVRHVQCSPLKIRE